MNTLAPWQHRLCTANTAHYYILHKVDNKKCMTRPIQSSFLCVFLNIMDRHAFIWLTLDLGGKMQTKCDTWIINNVNIVVTSLEVNSLSSILHTVVFTYTCTVCIHNLRSILDTGVIELVQYNTWKSLYSPVQLSFNTRVSALCTLGHSCNILFWTFALQHIALYFHSCTLACTFMLLFLLHVLLWCFVMILCTVIYCVYMVFDIHCPIQINKKNKLNCDETSFYQTYQISPSSSSPEPLSLTQGAFIKAGFMQGGGWPLWGDPCTAGGLFWREQQDQIYNHRKTNTTGVTEEMKSINHQSHPTIPPPKNTHLYTHTQANKQEAVVFSNNTTQVSACRTDTVRAVTTNTDKKSDNETPITRCNDAITRSGWTKLSAGSLNNDIFS